MKLDIKILFRKPTDVQEAIEKRDTAKPLMLGSFAVAIVFAVLGSILKWDFFESLGMIAVVVAVALFAVWIFAKRTAARMENVFCVCGERFSFPEDVTYEVVGEQISSGKEANSTNISRHTNTKVALQCKCHKCGKDRSFQTSIITKKDVLNERGVLLRNYDYPLEEELKKYFKD